MKKNKAIKFTRSDLLTHSDPHPCSQNAESKKEVRTLPDTRTCARRFCVPFSRKQKSAWRAQNLLLPGGMYDLWQVLPARYCSVLEY